MSGMSRAALERVVDPTDDARDRAAAAERLGLDATTFYRVVAVPASASLVGPSGVAQTVAGPVRFAVRSLAAELPQSRAGIGLAFVPSALHLSWSSALLALRLSSRYKPVVRADDLGTMLLIAEAADAAPTDHSDLAALKFLLRSQPKALALLEALAATANIKAAANETGLRIEAIRERAQQFLRSLGFDVLTPRGRARLALALALFRLQTNRFE